MSGTSVEKDFVELPSQLYEHWLMRPEVLEKFARHYKTGKPLPEALLAKHQGGAQLQPGLRDGRNMWPRRSSISTCTRWRTRKGLDVDAFEKKTLERIGMPAEIVHAPPHPAFPAHHRRLCRGLLQLHVVGGDGRRRVQGLRGDGRRLRSDQLAKTLYDNIYSAGGKQDPADAYKAFRGRLPTTAALLEKRGLAGGGA